MGGSSGSCRAESKEVIVSYLEKIDISSILICPFCGSDCVDNDSISSSVCITCGLYFYLSKIQVDRIKVRIDSENVKYFKVHASRKRMRSIDDWDWVIRIYETEVTLWMHWQGNRTRIDERSLEEVKHFIEQRWEAQQVLIALRS